MLMHTLCKVAQSQNPRKFLGAQLTLAICMHLYNVIGFGPLEKFRGMMVDLKLIHANGYVVRQGSTPGTEKMSMNIHSPHTVHSIDEV